MSDGLSLRQYAKQKGISAQAASQAFKRHQVELDGMYEKRGNAIYLNDQGIKILDAAREKQPAAVISQNNAAEMKLRIAALEKQLAEEREEIRRLQDLTREKDMMITTKDQQIIALNDRIMGMTQQLTTTKPKRGLFSLFRRRENEMPGENENVNS